MKKATFLIIISSFILINCGSKKSSSELLNEGQKYSEEKNYPEAVVSYETLINEYPEDDFAPDALTRLATIYQNRLLKTISETESLGKAVDLFKSIYEKYKDSKQAPMGLFMAGFVQANELKDYDAATETYNLFLKVYPEHELSSSAKEELDNMGLTPEEILQKNIARQK